jgi:pyruvate kinase
MTRRFGSTKIVATLGPSSSSQEIIRQLFQAGVSVFRLNFSHGTYEGHAHNINNIRQVEAEFNHPIAIMQDLQGPKLRIGRFEKGPITLTAGDRFCFDQDKTLGSQQRVHLPHPELFRVLNPGLDILMNDGQVRVRVISCDQTSCVTEVIYGGALSDHKGVNIPGAELPVNAMTGKDWADLDFGLSQGVDIVALSFVQRPEDILEARKRIQDRALIASKIEKPQALQHIDEIISLSDMIMVARGDLGVELPPEEVPRVQKQLIRQCRARGKPVIVATQMLDSMVAHPTPTRAEASDVAHAVYDGADAVMLSAESASGQYPVESVAMMRRIIEKVENDPFFRRTLLVNQAFPQATISDALTAAAHKIADTLSLGAIVTLTQTGNTALRMARERTNAPIIALTPDQTIARFLSVAWGVHPYCVAHRFDLETFDGVIAHINEVLLAQGYSKVGEEVLVTLGTQGPLSLKHPIFKAGTTRGLYILTVQEPHSKAA